MQRAIGNKPEIARYLRLTQVEHGQLLFSDSSDELCKRRPHLASLLRLRHPDNSVVSRKFLASRLIKQVVGLGSDFHSGHQGHPTELAAKKHPRTVSCVVSSSHAQPTSEQVPFRRTEWRTSNLRCDEGPSHPDNFKRSQHVLNQDAVEFATKLRRGTLIVVRDNVHVDAEASARVEFLLKV